MKKKMALLGILVSLVVALALFGATPRGKAAMIRLSAALGFAKLERALDATPGTKIVYSPDPSKTVAWVDLDRSGGLGVGDGPNGNWSEDSPHGGIVGFTDGSVAGFSQLSIRGSGGIITVSP